MFKPAICAFLAGITTIAVAKAEMPEGEYLEGGTSKSAVILAHGQGLDPDSQVVGTLRKGIHSKLGMHTLSLQMPVVQGKKSPDKFKEYEATFPEAFQSIQNGIDFLKDKGAERIYLMGYSMGGRMTSAFLAQNSNSDIAGFIGVGLLGGGKTPLNTNINLRSVNIPVLDIYAEDDNDAKFAEFRKAFVSARYTQVSVAGAKHDYRCCEETIQNTVVKWLSDMEGKR